ncbi:unnamed protein product [Rotaria sordida]|uniref:Uncharacterized protein n=1 Tax=Rotaria sordida TaxID=392033 RepID=A0A814BC48_9BILA|nr:unnamed protein product [Rotaria sordida]
MNALEEEYSFLAPTWKLPSIGTTSMYPGTYDASYLSSGSGLDSETINRNNQTYNPRYVPQPTNYPQTTNQQPRRRPIPSGPPPPPPPPLQTHQHNENLNVNHDLTINHNSQNDEYNIPIQPRNNNGYSNQQIDNRNLNYPSPPQPIQKRVQIIDHNRQTPSTDIISGRESHNSSPYNNNYHSPEINQNHQKFKSRRNQNDDNKSDSNVQRSHNFNVHEYLYGLSAPHPGSYVSAFKNHRRRLQDEKYNPKSVMTEYKNFVQNGGFGPAFNNYDHLAYEQKLQTENKRKTYSKIVRTTNQYKVEEQKRIQNNGGQQRHGVYVSPMLRRRPPPDATRSHFLSAEESRLGIPYRYSILSPILIASLPTHRYVLNSPLLHQSIFDKLHPWNQNDILSGEFYVDRTNRSSSISTCSHLPKNKSYSFL